MSFYNLLVKLSDHNIICSQVLSYNDNLTKNYDTYLGTYYTIHLSSVNIFFLFKLCHFVLQLVSTTK